MFEYIHISCHINAYNSDITVIISLSEQHDLDARILEITVFSLSNIPYTYREA
jgi:hypothetical protein